MTLTSMPENDFLLNATWSLVKHQSDSNLITTSNLDAISAKYINKNQNVNLILDIKIIDKAVLPAETNSLISNHIKNNLNKRTKKIASNTNVKKFQ